MPRLVRLFMLICCCCSALPCPEPAFAAPFTGPQSLVPLQAALPEPWGVLKLLLLVTFFIHLVLVNIVLGSSVIALVKSFRKKAGPGFRMKAETSFIPTVLALAVNFGVAPYLFMQVLYGSFFFPSTLLMSVWWLAIIGFVMLAYYGLYIIGDKSTSGLRAARPMLLVIICLFCAAAFVFSNNSTLMLRPENWLEWIRQPHGTLLNTADPTLVPRYLHLLVASLAVGGLTFACRARWRRGKPGTGADDAEKRIRTGLAWFRNSTLLQIPVGFWFFMTLPPEVRQLFLGGSPVAATAFALLAAGLCISLFFAYTNRVYAATAAAAGLVLVMVGVRDMVRDAMLLPYLDIRYTPGNGVEQALSSLLLDKGQNGAFALFLICAVLASAVIMVMVRASARSLRESPKTGLAGQGGE